ncbi:MAG: DUF1080 domain-containing protein, partial [Prolixibacteraceae bacterium]|nr:DUF1080 domain-containing protein [Prolixibacteraceae bacterium]
MKKFKNILFLLALTLFINISAMAQSAPEGAKVIGRWNLTVVIEDKALEELGLFRHGLMDTKGFPGWLEVKLSGFSTLVGYYVGYEGSARPISEIHYSKEDQKYNFTIPPQWMDIEDIYFEFTLKDNKLTGYEILDGQKLQWTGVRAPDLTRKEPPVWGNPKNLLDNNMSRWIIPENNKFRMVNGVLVNEDDGGNLVTKEKFDDFKLSMEFRYPEGSNSGVYLRGRYEMQIIDSYGQDINSMTIGGVYGFIEPSVDAAKKAGEWQTFEITFVGRHITLVHNGIEVISNRPVPGITGGSLDSDEGNPGPIMLQGDHGRGEFRKIVITPA